MRSTPRRTLKVSDSVERASETASVLSPLIVTARSPRASGNSYGDLVRSIGMGADRTPSPRGVISRTFDPSRLLVLMLASLRSPRRTSSLTSKSTKTRVPSRSTEVTWPTRKPATCTACGVVAMPSRFETFGIVAVEGHASGTPVVAFDIACLREVVPPGTGRLVPPFDVDAFADALVELAENPEQAVEMGRQGRAFAHRFDWPRIAEQQRVLYEEAIAAGRPTRPRRPGRRRR